MRHGYTTGSCAAAAAKAATIMLLGGEKKEDIMIIVPAGEEYRATIHDIKTEEDSVSCAVKKDAGDDPDVTNGILIYAKVQKLPGEDKNIIIEGGEGVGRVTKKGLDQPVGSAAINSVPRKMIEKEVREVADIFAYEGSILVKIYVPEGREIAKKTFNERLGIEGGISIIGTTGIVEPMSKRALLETIKLELNQKKEEGKEIAIISPGNYGMEFLKNELGINMEDAVKCSNFIGDTIDYAVETGFKRILLVGHIGKLIKLSGGIMNTHSKEADGRMELMALAAYNAGADKKLCDGILECISTDAAYELIKEAGIENECMDFVIKRAEKYLKLRAGEGVNIDCIMFSNTEGILAKTKGINERKGL